MGLVLGPPTGSAIVTVWCLTPTTTVCVMRTKLLDAQMLLRATTTQGLRMKTALVNSVLAQNRPSPCPWIHSPQRQEGLTTYRVYVNTLSSTDRLSAVISNADNP